MNDYELQRHELLRLLNTANSEERKQHIQSALDALDKAVESPSLYSAQASHIFHMPVEKVTGAMARPHSARRRPTINLNAIPEVIVATFPCGVLRNLIEIPQKMVTVVEDRPYPDTNLTQGVQISKIIATSTDPRFPPDSLLGEHPQPWVSTGLSPQVLSVYFEQPFVLNQVCLNMVCFECRRLTDEQVTVSCFNVMSIAVRAAPNQPLTQLVVNESER